jgi:hypothetical protein
VLFYGSENVSKSPCIFRVQVRHNPFTETDASNWLECSETLLSRLHLLRELNGKILESDEDEVDDASNSTHTPSPSTTVHGSGAEDSGSAAVASRSSCGDMHASGRADGGSAKEASIPSSSNYSIEVMDMMGGIESPNQEASGKCLPQSPGIGGEAARSGLSSQRGDIGEDDSVVESSLSGGEVTQLNSGATGAAAVSIDTEAGNVGTRDEAMATRSRGGAMHDILQEASCVEMPSDTKATTSLSMHGDPAARSEEGRQRDSEMANNEQGYVHCQHLLTELAPFMHDVLNRVQCLKVRSCPRGKTRICADQQINCIMRP